jgi:serine/threonine protein kinase/Tol biopolymer transport system component
MPLTTGTRLGSYVIEAAIGAGGMGEVYLARDTKLDRDVAIKLLPDAVASSPDRIARFEREAKTLAALNHPNIAAVFGLERLRPHRAEDMGIRGEVSASVRAGGAAPAPRNDDAGEGTLALVMELVEGEDLSQTIAHGPFALPQALTIAKQIADALEAAHDRGIVHRDLKPANIKVRPDGTVKVLDFGLAKALDPGGPEGPHYGSPPSQSPTLTTPAMTGANVILGTAAYMAPEQAKGRAIDKRADVWACGATLYEMLTGRRAFPGEDVSDTLAAVLRAEVDWSALPAGTPPAIRRLLRRCLEKDPRQRLSDMAMARIELRDAEQEPIEPVASALVQQKSRRPLGLAIAMALVAAIVSGAAVWWARRPVETPRPIVRFSIGMPDRTGLNVARDAVAVSPDGRYVACVANQRVYLRALDQLDGTPISGTEAGGAQQYAVAPFFSPDGQWVAYFQQGQLRKSAVTGGAAVALADASSVAAGASWGADDEILLGLSTGGIGRVRGSGGTIETLIPSEGGERLHDPQALPRGGWILFTAHPSTNVEQGQVVVWSRTTGERRVLLDSVRLARYVPTGHLVYAQGNSLLAQRFDLDRLELDGRPVPLLDGVANAAGSTPAVHFDVGADGTLVYVPELSGGTVATSLVLANRDGTRSVLAQLSAVGWFPRFSPDGTRVAFAESADQANGSDADLWVQEIARGARTRVTFGGNNRFYPIWTRDGTRLTFADGSGNTNRLLQAPADGSGGAQVLLEEGDRRFPTSWSPDGSHLAFYLGPAGTTTNTRDLWMLERQGEKWTPVPYVETPFSERGAIFSPDGRWVAYVSDKSGQNDVYVRPFPGPGSEITISVSGGQEPVWAPSGREIFYRHDAKLMSVPVQPSAASLQVGTPKALFDDPFRLDTGGALGGMANYDVSPDGRRFVMVANADGAGGAPPPLQINVVLNWFTELQARAPTR